MRQLLHLLVFSFLFVIQSHAKSIVIDTDENDCVDGWISMDVTVRVDDERFTFDPSCKFSFSENFKTSDGTACRIEAGMCSSFSPQNKIEVSCESSFSESVDVKCSASEISHGNTSSGVEAGQPGGKCKSSLDCPKSSFCHDGFCDAPIGGCIAKEGVCRSNLDCCSSLFCREDSNYKQKICK